MGGEDERGGRSPGVGVFNGMTWSSGPLKEFPVKNWDGLRLHVFCC